MHLVYGHAHFTICAADGDAGSGLTAVRRTLRTGARPPALSAMDSASVPSSMKGAQASARQAFARPTTTGNVRFAANSTETSDAGGSSNINGAIGSSLVARYNSDVELLVARSPEAVIQDSAWSSRGWTFQERLLSRRCLIFVDGRVYFQCRTSCMSQDVHDDPGPGERGTKKDQRKRARFRRRMDRGDSSDDEDEDEDEDEDDDDDGHGDSTSHRDHDDGGHTGWSLNWADSQLRTLDELRRRAFWFYARCVQQYTGRVLTKPKDVLAAFQGTSWLLRQHTRAPLLYGLPTSHFDLALLWMPLSELRRRKPSKHWGLLRPPWATTLQPV
jgi:hypothetical protein